MLPIVDTLYQLPVGTTVRIIGSHRSAGPRASKPWRLSMNKKNIAYWITTALIAFVFGMGGIMDLSNSAQVKEGLAHLGYPVYFASMLGVWKLLGAAALLAPRFPRLKEWAYAGMFFDLTSASISHVMYL
jgi:hypothetical protein